MQIDGRVNYFKSIQLILAGGLEVIPTRIINKHDYMSQYASEVKIVIIIFWICQKDNELYSLWFCV